MDTLSNITEELENLRGKMRQQNEIIHETRRRYEELVDELYQLKPPFPQPRNGTEEERNSDIEQIYDITVQCVILGETKLLKKYVIDPVYSGKLSMKADIIVGLNTLIERTEEQPTAQCYLIWVRENLEKKLGNNNKGMARAQE